MKTYQLIGLGMLAVGLLLLNKSQKKSRPVIKGVAIHPTAIFIWQGSSKRPSIEFYHH